MDIKQILNGIVYEIIIDNKFKGYKEIEINSKQIEYGDVFIAIKGEKFNGHNFIENAINNGAKLIIYSDKKFAITKFLDDVSYVFVKNLKKYKSKIASNFYNYPQDKLKIIGITGTNGKTTISYIISNVIGENISKIGTIEYKIGDEILEAPNTTPDAVDVIKICHKSVQKGIRYLIMEVSSHALILDRVTELKFDIVIFSNLTKEHLDFHKNMQNYYEAKSSLFKKLKENGSGIVNADDKWCMKVKENFAKILTCSIENKDSNCYGEIVSLNCNFMKLKIQKLNKNIEFKVPIIGEYNLYNILFSYLALIKLGFKSDEIIEKFEKLNQIPGRFQIIPNTKKRLAVIDFAHTKDALENILKLSKKISKKRILLVFGAGGDRDKFKRPEMAKVGAKYCDFIIITSDNPRTENPKTILKDIELGFKKINFEKYEIEEDREIAILKIISFSDDDDIILIAGKGHENYQIIGTQKKYFNDFEITNKYIEEI